MLNEKNGVSEMKKMFLKKGNRALKLLFSAIFLFTSVFTIMPAIVAEAYTTGSPTQEFSKSEFNSYIGSLYGVKFDGIDQQSFTADTNGSTTVWKKNGSSLTLSQLSNIQVKYVSVKTGSQYGQWFLYNAITGEQVYPSGQTPRYSVSVSYDSNGYPSVTVTAINGGQNISHMAIFLSGSRVGKITVTKAFKGTGGSDTQQFNITVTGPNNYNKTLPVSVNQSAVFDKLPDGVYTVKEEDPSSLGYMLFSINGQTQNIANGIQVTVGDPNISGASIECIPDYDVDVTVINKKLGKLTLKKEFLDGYSDTTTQFKFRLQKSDPGGWSKDITVTGDPSGVIENNLGWGNYSIQELTGTDMPTGFTFSVLKMNGSTVSNPYSFTIGENTAKDFTFTAINDTWAKLIIKKVDATDNNKVLAGAQFKVYNDAGLQYTGTTNSEGKIIFDSEPQGFVAGSTWHVQETSAPPNYRKDPNDIKDVTLQPGENTVTFENTPVGSIKIYKVLESGSDTSTVFNFHISGPNKEADFTLKADGTPATFDNLDYGQYTITETDPSASNYKLLGFREGTTGPLQSDSITVSVNGPTTVTVDAINRKQGKIILQKELAQGSVLSDPARKFTLRITNTDTNTYHDYDVTAGSPLTLENIDYGNYTVQEIGLTSGTELVDLFINNVKVTAPDKIGQFTIGTGDTQVLEVTVRAVNRTWGKIKLVKVNAEDQNETLPGAKFRIANNDQFSTQNGGIVYTDLTTDANGEIAITDEMIVGSTWYIQETKAPDGYFLDDTVISKTLKEGVNTFTITDKPECWIKIYKIDSLTNAPLAGAVFEIANNAGFLNTGKTGDVDNVCFEITTGDGPTLTEGLVPGHWWVREKSAPSGYLKDTHTEDFTVAWHETKELHFANTPVGKIVVTKALDGGYTDPTTEFEITVTCDNPAYSQTKKVKGGSSVTFDNLPYGEYTVTETDPASLGYKLLGYTVNGMPYDTASVKVTVGDNTPSPTLLSAIVGMVRLDPWNQQVTVTNRKLAKLTLSKTFLNGWTNTDDEFTFTVAKDGGLPKSYTVKSGSDVVLDGLDYGSYEIAETGMPAGYVFSKMYINNVPTTDNPVTVTLGATNLDVTVKAENDKQIQLKVLKFSSTTGEPLADMHFLVADNADFENRPGGIYFSDETNDKGEFISGQYFPYGTTLWVKETQAPPHYLIDPNPQSITLTYTNNVVTFRDPPDDYGWIKIVKYDYDTEQRLNGARFEIANNENFSNSFFIDVTANGEVTTNQLTAGDWWVREVQAPAGYIKDDTVQKITVVWRETAEVTFWNRQAGDMKITKVDAENGAKLSGAKFDIFTDSQLTLKYASIEITDPAGTTLTAPVGTYYFVETQAPAGYTLNTTPVEVKVEFGKTATVELKNSKKDNVIWKKDSATLANLTGAEFDIYNNSTNAFIGHFVTDADGKIPLTGFTTGTYKAIETKAPTGYKLLTTPVIFPIVEGQTGNVIILNTSEQDYGSGSLKIRKVDATTLKPLAGAVFDIYFDSGLTAKAYSGLVSNASGEFQVDGMDPGDYWIVETAAPTGYKKISGSIKATVVKNQTTTIVVQNTGEQDYQTGTDDYNMLVLGGILLIAGAAMIFFYMRKKVRTN